MAARQSVPPSRSPSGPGVAWGALIIRRAWGPVQDGGKQSIVDLVATTPNLMVAQLAAPLSTGAKIAVTIKLGDGHDVKARFVAR